jgi:parallel beta-helix repeat protein
MTRSGRVPEILIASSLATLGAICFGPGQAQANHVACGDTITANTTLDSDLLDCPNNGIVIGADDVTLDLNGHVVDGDDTEFVACPPDELCDTGILDDDRDGLVIKDGSVGQFAIGVFMGRTRHSRVLDISSSENALFGFIFVESARSGIRNSSGSRNLDPDGDGLGLFGSRHIRIVHNSFRRNLLGIHVFESTENVIKRNVISRTPGPGIILEQANRNQVRRNRCARNDGCLIVAPGNRNVIARNRIVRGDSGIGVEKGRRNVVSRNIVVDPRQVGIYLGLNHPPIGSSHTVVRRNRVRGSGGDGFFVAETDNDSRLNRNVAIGAEDDGFDIRSATATLIGNRTR